MSEKPRKLTLCIDFDGVIHSYMTPWQGPLEIPDPPVPGAFEALGAYATFFRVVIYSSRSKDPKFPHACCSWMLKHGADPELFGKLEFANEKPAAFLTIDDRAWSFNGTWPPVTMLQNYKPWNR